MPEKRPFIEDGSQFGISLTDFRRKRKAEKRELMIQWFHEHFEDPAVRTPYESAEGGYQWIWGGPYDARDQLYSQFGRLVSEALIEEVAEEVESEGLTDWAPVPSPDDYDEEEVYDEPVSLDIFLDEPSDQFGTPAERKARTQARDALLQLKNALNRRRPIGIGHNQPPPDDEPDEIKELRSAIPRLNAELSKPKPSIPTVKRWVAPLRNALIASLKWTVRKLDKGVDGVVAAAGIAGATWLWSHYDASLHAAFNAIIYWLEIAAKVLL